MLALAGRRVDALGSRTIRFPLQRVPVVRRRIRRFLKDRRVSQLVCSAACGADLLALEAAESLGIRRHVVLPFEPARFRETSVADRPGDWVESFDRLVRQAQRAGELTVLEDAASGEPTYAAANEAILAQALRAAAGDEPGAPARPVQAVIVWDGQSRGEADLTARFAREAGAMGLEVVEISTL